MHQHAVDGYKRSNIPKPGDVQGEVILGKIKAVRTFSIFVLVHALWKVPGRYVKWNNCSRNIFKT